MDLLLIFAKFIVSFFFSCFLKKLMICVADLFPKVRRVALSQGWADLRFEGTACQSSGV